MIQNAKNVLLLVFIIAGLLYGSYFLFGPKTNSSDINKETVKDVKTVTTITEDKDGNKKTVITKESKTNTVTEIKPKSNKYKVALMVGGMLNSSVRQQPVYGVSVSKELIGPVTVGVFGFSNGFVGVSLGSSF